MSTSPIKQFLTLSLIVLTGVMSGTAYASHLKPYHMEYKVETKGFNLTMVRELKQKDQHWQIKQVSKNMFLKLTETSDFIWQQQQLLSKRYHYQRKVMGHNKTFALDFNHGKQQAQYTQKGKDSKSIAFDTPAYDALNYQLLIRQQLQQGTLTDQKVILPVIERNRLRQFEFSLLGEELLDTPAGQLKTVKLQRMRSKKKKNTTIWLAKDWDYVVVKVLHTEEGKDPTTLTLKQGSVADKTIVGKLIPPLETDGEDEEDEDL